MTTSGAEYRGSIIFRAGGEVAHMPDCDDSGRITEGGHMSCTGGRIVSTPGANMPFLAVMTRENGSTFEAAFATMAEAEAFVRRNTPRPAPRSTTYDRDAG